MKSDDHAADIFAGLGWRRVSVIRNGFFIDEEQG